MVVPLLKTITNLTTTCHTESDSRKPAAMSPDSLIDFLKSL